MSINNNIVYKRELKLKNCPSSCFLFGPRMTGKTQLLKQLKTDAYYDLLDPALEREFLARPETFWEEISAFKPGSKLSLMKFKKHQFF